MTRAAIDTAMDAVHRPLQLQRAGAMQLPRNMIDVIKCAAGDPASLEDAVRTRLSTEQQVQDAARFYLQAVISSGGPDPYRTLGLNRLADVEEVREHRRWLLKWLHPDRNPNKWEATLFTRVEQASALLLNGPENDAGVLAGDDVHLRQAGQQRPWVVKPPMVLAPRNVRVAGQISKAVYPIVLAIAAAALIVSLLQYDTMAQLVAAYRI